MKKAISISEYLFVALLVLLPFGVLLSSCFGYEFKLADDTIFAVLTAVLSVGLVVLCAIAKDFPGSRTNTVLLGVSPLLALINAAFYLYVSSSVWVVVCMLICVGCCFYLAVRFGKPKSFRIVSLVLSVLLVLPVGFIGFGFLFFGNIGQDAVIQTVESPNSAYYAEVLDSDQGALGGYTLVTVHETKSINAVVFRISKKPQDIYYGDWGEFQDMEVSWKSENCLIINSVEYPIE